MLAVYIVFILATLLKCHGESFHGIKNEASSYYMPNLQSFISAPESDCKSCGNWLDPFAMQNCMRSCRSGDSVTFQRGPRTPCQACFRQPNVQSFTSCLGSCHPDDRTSILISLDQLYQTMKREIETNSYNRLPDKTQKINRYPRNCAEKCMQAYTEHERFACNIECTEYNTNFKVLKPASSYDRNKKISSYSKANIVDTRLPENFEETDDEISRSIDSDDSRGFAGYKSVKRMNPGVQVVDGGKINSPGKNPVEREQSHLLDVVTKKSAVETSTVMDNARAEKNSAFSDGEPSSETSEATAAVEKGKENYK